MANVCFVHKDPAAKSQANKEIAQLLDWPENLRNNTDTQRIRVGEAIRYFNDDLFPHLPRRGYQVRVNLSFGSRMGLAVPCPRNYKIIRLLYSWPSAGKEIHIVRMRARERAVQEINSWPMIWTEFAYSADPDVESGWVVRSDVGSPGGGRRYSSQDPNFPGPRRLSSRRHHALARSAARGNCLT